MEPSVVPPLLLDVRAESVRQTTLELTMTFTDLEYVLMIAVFALLWRASVANRKADYEEDRASQYANHLISIYEGKGSVVKDDEGRYMFKQKETNQ